MNYLIEFAKNEPIGFCVFIFCVTCLCVAMGLLINQSNTYSYEMAKPPRPENPEKTDFSEMCPECFGSMISKMPLRTICDFKEVERQRMIGCSHKSKIKISTKGIDSSELITLLPLVIKLVNIEIDKSKPIGPPNTKLNGDPLDKKAVKS